MLEFALSQEYEPGINRAGHQAEGVWLFLLPNLRIEEVVCVGVPSAGTQTGLEALGARVVRSTPSQLARSVST